MNWAGKIAAALADWTKARRFMMRPLKMNQKSSG
jgi:hypothetical protein